MHKYSNSLLAHTFHLNLVTPIQNKWSKTARSNKAKNIYIIVFFLTKALMLLFLLTFKRSWCLHFEKFKWYSCCDHIVQLYMCTSPGKSLLRHATYPALVPIEHWDLAWFLCHWGFIVYNLCSHVLWTRLLWANYILPFSNIWVRYCSWFKHKFSKYKYKIY